VDAAGRVTRVSDTPRTFREPRLSPDGRRVAVVIGRGTDADLWILDIATGTLSQLTFGVAPRRPTWTPDGKAVTVGAREGGGWKLMTFGLGDTGKPVTHVETPYRAYPNTWSPDGRRLVYQERRPGTGWDIVAAEVGPGSAAVSTRPLAATPAQEENAVLSADGRFVAYESDELDGVFEVYVRPVAEGGAKVRASTTGARWPRFGPPGALFYWLSFKGGLQRIDYHAAGNGFAVDGVAPVWPAGDGEAPPDAPRRVLVTAGFGGFDPDPTGRRFLMLEKTPAALATSLQAPVLLFNWPDGLRTRAGDRP